MLKNANVVGQNVVKFRHRAGWTQDDLVAKMQLLECCMTRDILANIETRRSPVTDERIMLFAQVLGVEIGCLFPKNNSARHIRRYAESCQPYRTLKACQNLVSPRYKPSPSMSLETHIDWLGQTHLVGKPNEDVCLVLGA
jgi:transcriptional regulator with XRE-family HTH domain